MKRNRSKYTQSLDLRGILRIVIGAAIVAGLACGFVHVRTQHVTRGGEKGKLEKEIESLAKEIDLIASRVAEVMEPEAMKRRLMIEGSELVEIGHDYNSVTGSIVERMAMSDRGGYVYP